MRAVDTNVLVRMVTRDDPKQVAAADAFVQSGAWVSVLALAEDTWVLGAVYDRDVGQVALAVEMLLNHQHLTLQEPEAVATLASAFGSCAPRFSADVRPTLGNAREGIVA